MNSPESRRIENILASISDCFYALDSQSRFIYLNPQAEQYFGLAREELMGRVVWEAFPQAVGTIFEREYKRVMKDGGRSRFEARSVATGRWVEMTIYAQPKDPAIVDGGGGIAVYFRDIHDAREAERLNRERAESYCLLVENAREYAIIGFDLDGKITHWNEGAKRIFGWSEGEAVGQGGELLFIPEDNQNRIFQIEIAQAVKTGRANDERILVRKDGSSFWALGDMMALYEDDGSLRGFMKILRDNTERRNAEDDFRRVQEKLQETQQWLEKVSRQVGISFWIWEPERDVITYQHALDTLFGAHFDSFKGFREFLHPDDRDTVGNVIGRAIALVEDYELEFRVRRHPDAEPENEADWKWILSVVSAQKNGSEPLRLSGINLDITARKQAQLQLERSQKRLKDVARDARVAIWAWDPIRDVVHDKFMLDELFGYEVTSFAGFALRCHPDDVQPTLDCAHRVIGEGEKSEVNYRLPNVPNPNPTRIEDWRWFLCKMSPARREPGEELIYGVTIDITQQKLAQEEVVRSEKRYAALVEETNTMVWSGSPDLSYLEMPGWSQITGQSEAEWQVNWADAIHPDDRERILKTWEHAVKHSEGFEITYLLRHKDGKYRFNTGRAVPVFEDDGTLREWIGTNTNTDEIITAQNALRDSERRYRALIDASPQIVWESAPNGDVTYGNDFWLKYSGVTLEQVLGQGWRCCISTEDLESLRSDWLLARNEKRLFERELRIWSAAHGEFRWHLTRSLPILNDQGEIEKWIGSSTEIHARKLADEIRENLLAEEQKARRGAETASRQKDEFLAIVSHELRTPLNAILGWSNLLRTTELPTQTQLEGLQVIERSARAQAQLVDDILDVARVISGKMKVEKRSLDLGELARETLESLAPSAHSRSIELNGVTRPLRVSGDPIRLRQVLWNLLSNALKFTPQGGKVRLSMREENGRAIVEISDSGAGIASEFLPHVFDRFRQADSSSTRKHGGLGLGLAIVSSIVEIHEGTVRADSAGLGQGATFTVELPLATDGAVVPSASPDASGEGKLLNGRNLLIVDDAADTLQLTAFLLQRAGAEVQTASSVVEARTLFEQGCFDLVVSDLAMPGADGYEFLRWLQVQNPQVATIALTAFASSREEQRVREAGFDGFVPKPVDGARLIREIHAVLRQREGVFSQNGV